MNITESYKKLEEEKLNHSNWKVFSKQSFAFEFMKEKQLQDGFDSELKLFCYEDAEREGQRKYLVTNYQEFIKRYLSMEKDQRHFYEIIQEEQPCRVYFYI